ncbi:DUF2252 domain-containing protein [Skermania piniformis]|uniref:DUF2252 domain-containing protein n=1 Tax=Skermania pinensis TaxID=39122 RepID=A0ABX8SFN8_9ACTN|nr:DUF2252 domain-containing protein [Skermania piniformis]
MPTSGQRAAGRQLRAAARRSEQAGLDLPGDRDPIALLRAQNRNRVPQLVPVRRERMSESPFAFFRGAAAVMAADLAGTPRTGHTIQLCGDAHLSNFGVFAGRDRDLVFDVDDFDEASVGPWEWDVKRLVASVVILGDELNLAPEQIRRAAELTAQAYRTTVERLATLSVTERFYVKISAATIEELAGPVARRARRGRDKFLAKAARNTSVRALDKLAVRADDGRYRIQSQPPLIVHLPQFDRSFAQPLFDRYVGTVPADVAQVLTSMQLDDLVVKVVGVGSVGTRCLLALFTDPDGNPLFLQLKEAEASVLERYAGPARWRNHAERVVGGQRILQATGDPFLGWFDDHHGTQYYVRQFRDMKGSVDVVRLAEKGRLRSYGRLCGTALARAHAQSGTPGVIAGYLGGHPDVRRVDRAFAEFGFAYCAVNRGDYERLLAAAPADWYAPDDHDHEQDAG